MKRSSLCMLLLAGLIILLAGGDALTQPKDEKKGPPKGKDGQRKFAIGTVIPPHIRPDLNLTEEQAKAIADLERDVRERLNKILTAEQKRTFEESEPPPKDKDKDGPQGKDKGKGKDKDKGKDGPPGKGKDKDKDGPRPKDKDNNDSVSTMTGGIQWFAVWDAALAEAKRTNKPILLVSAAPHCAGVSGIW